MKKFILYIFLITGIHITPGLYAQKVTEPQNNPADWSKPYEPFRIAGNLYYVGTYDLASYLIVTGRGNILINTGLADSYTTIKKNIEKLGFRYSDIKILLTTQAHFDHLGALAALARGAQHRGFWRGQSQGGQCRAVRHAWHGSKMPATSIHMCAHVHVVRVYADTCVRMYMPPRPRSPGAEVVAVYDAVGAEPHLAVAVRDRADLAVPERGLPGHARAAEA